LNKTNLLMVNELVGWGSLIVISFCFSCLLLFVSLHETLYFIIVVLRFRLFLLVLLLSGFNLAYSILKVGHLLLLSSELGVHAIDALEIRDHLLLGDGQPVVMLLLEIRKKNLDGNLFGVGHFRLHVFFDVVVSNSSVHLLLVVIGVGLPEPSQRVTLLVGFYQAHLV
jgi:hypothetical protein